MPSIIQSGMESHAPQGSGPCEGLCFSWITCTCSGTGPTALGSASSGGHTHWLLGNNTGVADLTHGHRVLAAVQALGPFGQQMSGILSLSMHFSVLSMTTLNLAIGLNRTLHLWGQRPENLIPGT